MNKNYFNKNREPNKKFEIKSQKLFAQLKENLSKINYLDETISNIKSLPDKAKKEFSEKVVGCLEYKFYEAITIAVRVILIVLCFFEYELYEVAIMHAQRTKMITKWIAKDLNRLLHKRNKATHPSDEYPSQTITLAFIEKAVNIIKKIEERLKDKPPS